MKRQVTVNGRSGTIEIEGSRLRYLQEDGATVEGEFSIEGSSVLLNGRSYRVSQGAGKEIWVEGRRLSMEVFDPRDLRSGEGSWSNRGRQEIVASMPGKVVRVLVAQGESVQEGQGLVVVEAMKMQNEMKSPKAGRVVELRTRPDATVAAGEIMVVVE
jgi:biotin carboxyl carrier protein